MRMRNKKDITFSIFICISPGNDFLFLEYLFEDFNEMESMDSNHFAKFIKDNAKSISIII